jgi:DNA polymerase-3 subunit gamma/tau
VSDDSPPTDAGLFGDASGPAASGSGYLVLARKYRPRTFEELIGQEAMVRTIANSFALGRVPHAYVLTGVRGVGKTTTARLLARALNYRTDKVDAPSVTLSPLGVHCQAIMESRHPDVFEMDAASRTGINDIREILDSVRYAPVMARKKIYIIDEVHMLSVQAFNGLLKTLEEPPPHVKFIFATTEIRKVPVTVLSRCQRFDLKRVPSEQLAAHLDRICSAERVAVEPDGLTLVARAAEGSVRDALSLLDQALVQKHGDGAIRAEEIRAMLGLADRGRAIDLFSALVRADAKAALTDVRDQYEAGTDPALLLRDLLEVTHETARAQALGDGYSYAGGTDQAQRVQSLARDLSPAQVSRIWQMLLKALDETGRAPEPIAALEMAMVRLCAAQGLPPPEDAARLLAERRAAPSAEGGAIQREPRGDGPKLASFEDVLALIASRREAALEIDLERYVRLVEFEPGAIRYQPSPDAPEDLPLRLIRFLKEWTGETWRVSADGAAPAGVESLEERRARERDAELAALRAHPSVAEALAAFPGAVIAEVKRPNAQDGPRGDVTPFKRPPPRAQLGRKEGAS